MLTNYHVQYTVTEEKEKGKEGTQVFRVSMSCCRRENSIQVFKSIQVYPYDQCTLCGDNNAVCTALFFSHNRHRTRVSSYSWFTFMWYSSTGTSTQIIPPCYKERVGLRVLPPLIRIYNEMTVKLIVNDHVAY